MKGSLPVLFILLLPLSIFAQPWHMDANRLLKDFGLDDSQISQVMTVQKATEDAVKADLTHIRLSQAQIQEALLPANPDLNAINALIDKKGSLRTNIQKTIMAARIQAIKLMGKDNAEKYFRFVMRSMRPPFQGMMGRRMGMMGFGHPRFMPVQDGQEQSPFE